MRPGRGLKPTPRGVSRPTPGGWGWVSQHALRQATPTVDGYCYRQYASYLNAFLFGSFSTLYVKYNFMKNGIHPMQGQVKPNIQRLRKSQNSSLSGRVFGGHSIIAILDGSHYQKFKKWQLWLEHLRERLATKTKHL